MLFILQFVKTGIKLQVWKYILSGFGIAAAALGVIAAIDKPKSIYKNKPEDKNLFEGKKVRFVLNDSDPINADGERGHLEEVQCSEASSVYKQTFYERFLKRGLDLVLSCMGLLVLSPVLLALGAAIYLDDPGPILFTQKRVGKNKRYFALHKFRSMKMSTPHDVPTHMLDNPESYITRVGKILRKLSLDELPQLWDIFIGNMSIVGPRPALWNQDVLTALRDEYDANDIMPGLTGWAQVNGRDELELTEKAKLDGEYRRNISFRLDTACVLMTVANVLKQKGVIEGGTGAMKKLAGNNEIES